MSAVHLDRPGGRSVRLLAAASGTATALGGGALAGGWWWAVAGVAAVAAIGAATDRQLGFGQVLASLVLVGGVVVAGHDWYVAVLAAGTVASFELLAAADRVTLVRPAVPDLGWVARVVPSAAVLAAAVLVVGGVSGTLPAAGVAGAALAAVVGLRVVAR